MDLGPLTLAVAVIGGIIVLAVNIKNMKPKTGASSAIRQATVPHSPTSAPGWYADPKLPGSLQYWDGQKWTGQRAPAPTSTTARGQEWNLKIIGVLILVVLVLILAVLASSKPWQSEDYKACIAQNKRDAVDTYSQIEDAVEDYCDRNFG